jgi:hypothetical protein
MDEVRRPAVVLSGTCPVAARRGHHRQPFKPVMDLGIPREEVLRGRFGIVQSPRVDQIDHHVGGVVEAVVIGRQGYGCGLRARGDRAGRGGGFITGQTAALVFLAAAARTGVVAAGLRHHGLEASLYTTLLTDVTWFDVLTAIDRELAAAAQADGCQQCPGRLHHADYPRKPRGGPVDLPAAYDRRTSFCCARCRTRRTPPSVRFLGRRVYLGAVVVLACVLRYGPTPTRVARLREVLGVSGDTLRRWHRWWRTAFVRTAFWRAARARFVPPLDEATLPATLLARFPGEADTAMVALLRFLTPLSTLGAARG